LDLFEYQGKQLFAQYGVPVPEGDVATTPEAAREIAARLGGRVVVKAQVQVGGRGKAGGIKLAESPDEAEARARDILGMDIRGHTVRRVWIERAGDIAKEYYASITFDRGEKRPLFMLSKEGGVDIEEVAASSPEKIARLHVDPLLGFQAHHGRRLCFEAGIAEVRHVGSLLDKLYRAFIASDLMLAEVNPLVVSSDGTVTALDAKVTVDNNALFKHPALAALDKEHEGGDEQERMAKQRGVTYVKLDGDVGILGNGAGLVMSTLDVVEQAGGHAANFLDVGGGAQADLVVDALEVIISDPKVKAILFNIFGGITRCDEIARGILQALERLDIDVPIVVRLDGTNDEEGRAILREAAPPNLHPAATMLEAAAMVVDLARGGGA
jgi:succinyl-CoA synthetase beta subunit